MISTMLRIRKQFGIFWYLVIAGTYIIEIPVFFFCLIADTILHGGKAKYTWQNFRAYCTNIGMLLQYFFKILLNKPWFYKVS